MEDLHEPERYELTEGPPYRFEVDRREFLGAAGAGLLITVSGAVACRQQGTAPEVTPRRADCTSRTTA